MTDVDVATRVPHPGDAFLRSVAHSEPTSPPQFVAGGDPNVWIHPDAVRCDGHTGPFTSKPRLPHASWRPVYAALAALMYSDHRSFAIVRDKATKRVMCSVALSGHGKDGDWRDAGSTAAEADAWCGENVPGYRAARALVDAAAAVDTPTNPRKAAVRPAASRPVPQATEPTACAAEAVSAPVSADLPEWASDYLARLVHAPKREYAAAYLDHVLNHAPMPADPGTGWAGKVRARVEWLIR